MAATLLTEEEYQFLTNLEKDLLTRAKTASPRAGTHLRAVAKMHSDFIALEDGKRAAGAKKTAARNEREALKLQRQQERLAALQKQMQHPEAAAGSNPAAGQRRDRAQATA